MNVRQSGEALGPIRTYSSAAHHPSWTALREAVNAFRLLQASDGSIPTDTGLQMEAASGLATIQRLLLELAPLFPNHGAYFAALTADLTRWRQGGFQVPDFLDSLEQFHPELDRRHGVEHLVLFPMYTQNGNPHRNLEALLMRVVWPEWVADIESSIYGNPAFVPVEFLDHTDGYATHSAVLFPETVSVREVPTFTWGAIFCDREAARFRAVSHAVVRATHLELPEEAQELLEDVELSQEVFVLWDLVHDRAHSRGDLPFDPFMIKQRMPYWIYALEELRCDLNAFRAGVQLAEQGETRGLLLQYTILLDRGFRFPLSGDRVRNYDGLGGQLLFAYLHQRRVIHWTDNHLSIEWGRLAGTVLALLDEIEELYWRGIDRPKTVHWLAAYDLIATYLEPHPGSTWRHDRAALNYRGTRSELLSSVLSDEFPLSMFFEALANHVLPVIKSTVGVAA